MSFDILQKIEKCNDLQVGERKEQALVVSNERKWKLLKKHKYAISLGSMTLLQPSSNRR